MKIKYHIPTEEYGYTEIEKEFKSPVDISDYSYFDEDGNGLSKIPSYSDIKALLLPPVEPKKAPRSDVELYDKGFNDKIDKYLSTNKLSSEEYEKCTALQKMVIQCLGRAYERLEANK